MDNNILKIPFVKMTGAGNDFVLIDNLDHQWNLKWPEFAMNICNRRYGVGADGLLVIDQSSTAIFKMNYYNADGSYGGMCGNGGRCSAMYVMQKLNLTDLFFEALDYKYQAERMKNDVKLHMKDPKILQTNIKIHLSEFELSAHFIDSGAPHVIIFRKELSNHLQNTIDSTGITELCRTLRYHEKFAPGGSNVNFIDLIGNSTISMRTYERGVEDETMACGTGAVASAVCTSILQGYSSPIAVKTRSNELLKVYFSRKGDTFTDIVLEGPAQQVFQGSIYYSLSENRIQYFNR